MFLINQRRILMMMASLRMIQGLIVDQRMIRMMIYKMRGILMMILRRICILMTVRQVKVITIRRGLVQMKVHSQPLRKCPTSTFRQWVSKVTKIMTKTVIPAWGKKALQTMSYTRAQKYISEDHTKQGAVHQGGWQCAPSRLLPATGRE